jgi:cellulose synthase/poly-beta-1,6-N-acetylglucosamine synthase-like glycosyltransferase
VRALFIGACASLAWTYLAFPVLLVLRGLLRPRPVVAGDHAPSVSVIVAAYNEEAVIARKLDNLEQLEYPAHLLEVVVVSDGSTDRTAELVRARSAGATLVELPRSGKAAAIEAGVTAAIGEVLVFTDANSMLEPGAVRALVRSFADPSVGCVAGDQRYGPAGLADESGGERQYWAIDRLLKDAGSRAGNAIAATGALYAIRRTLFRPIPPGVNDDYFLSAGVVAQGYRIVFEPAAVAREPAAGTLRSEFARKVRVMSRAYRTELELRELLNPFQFGFYSLQLASQKILRRAGGVPLLVLLITTLFQSDRRWFRWLAILQVAGYASGVVGWMAPRGGGRMGRLLALPGYFVMSHVAGLIGLWNLVTGRRVDRWDTQRAVGATMDGSGDRESVRTPDASG